MYILPIYFRPSTHCKVKATLIHTNLFPSLLPKLRDGGGGKATKLGRLLLHSCRLVRVPSALSPPEKFLVSAKNYPEFRFLSQANALLSTLGTNLVYLVNR